MSTFTTPDGLTAEAVAKRILYLAWLACGGAFGMGVLQDKPSATENQVFDNVCKRGDYPSAGGVIPQVANDLYADYVFGRMMKLSVKIKNNTIELSDSEPRSDYQSWCRKYKTYGALFDAAVADLKKA